VENENNASEVLFLIGFVLKNSCKFEGGNYNFIHEETLSDILFEALANSNFNYKQ
jgi:hypothetical protein